LWNVLGQQDKSEAALQEMKATPARTRFDHFFLGELARTRHDYKAALSHYQDALQVDPDDYWSLNMIGDCHLHSQQPAAAAAAYTACIARRPDVFWPYIVRGIALADLQQFEQSDRDFEKAIELAPNTYFVLLNRGFVRLKRKDFDAAQADFNKAAELRPDLSAPHENLAEVSRMRARELVASNQPNGVVRAAAEFQNSLVELTKAIPLSPQQGRLYYARGLARVALSDPKSALDDFQRAIKLEPSPLRRAHSFREIGQIHQRANRLPEALAAFDQSLAQNPSDTSVIRERANVLLDLNRAAEAIEGFTKFLELEGPVGDVYRGRASAYAKSNKYREAINDYTMSLQYEPAPGMLKQRGKAYLLQATQLAKEDFEESLRLNPIDPDARWGLAHAMVMLGDHAGGAAELEKAAPTARRAAAQFGPLAWPLFYNPATTYAQALAKLPSDLKLSPERRDELARQYTTRAIELLTDAQRHAGPQFHKVFLDALRTDEALNPIRQYPEFREALKTLEAVPTAKSLKP
jgi:tetratricopeptide (TPR) repeat protein